MNAPYVNIHTHRSTGCGIERLGRGVHPWHADSVPMSQIDYAADDIVGEIGLDGVCGVDINVQMAVFRSQLEVAQRLGKVVVIHCVKAFYSIIKELRSFSPRAVIFHGFIGSQQMARDVLSRDNYFLSFGLRSLKSPRTVEVIKNLPVERMFLETDDDDVAIADIYSAVARLRQIDVELLKSTIFNNYQRIFV